MSRRWFNGKAARAMCASLGIIFHVVAVCAQTPLAPQQVVQANADAWSRGDAAGVLALFADDGRGYDRSTDPHQLAGKRSDTIGSKAQLAAYLEKASATPPARETITETATVGTLVIASGESAQPPDFTKRMRYLTGYRIRAGLIHDLWHIAWIPAASPESPDPTVVIRELIAANNARDADRFLALFSPDAKHFRYAEDPRTLADRPSATDAASREQAVRRYFAGATKHVEAIKLFSVGEFVVEQSQVTGFDGAPGKRVNEVSIYRIRDGRIVGRWLLGEEDLTPAATSPATNP